MTFEEIMDIRNRENNFAVYIGIKTTEIKLGYAKGEIILSEEHNNIISSIHGGCIFSLADTIGGAAVSSHGNLVTTVSGNFNYLSPAINTSKLVAVAKEVKFGKRISVCDVEIFNDQDKLLAKGTFTYFNLEKPIESKA